MIRRLQRMFDEEILKSFGLFIQKRAEEGGKMKEGDNSSQVGKNM